MDKTEKMRLARERIVRFGRGALASAFVALVAACGGGDKDAADPGGAGGPPPPTPPAAVTDAPTKVEASRFLAQSTMGPTTAEIDRLSTISYATWFDEQFAKAQTLHRLYINQATADAAAVGGQISEVNFFDSWWSQALGGEDQLRQRAAFALSEIFVVSFSNATLQAQPRGVASYYDMLAEKAFGNFRDLLEGVTYHPMMGIYLSHLKNQKEDPTTGRVPDLNFAREITQLFTIGQYKLNADGTLVMGTNGQPTLAYSSADLNGLSQVFTGLSWYAGPTVTDRTNARFFGGNANLERDWRPMQDYNEYTPNTSFHSISAKTFWQTTIAPQTTPDTVGDVKIALDTLFNNPERRAVHRQAADPAHGHQQPEPGLRRPRRGGVRQQRQRRARRHEGGLEGDPARPGGACRRHVVELRQAARAGAAPGPHAARLQRHLEERPLHRHRPHRRPGDAPEPDADVRADGLQLLPPGLRAVGRRAWRRPGSSFPRCRSRTSSRSPAT